MPSSFGRWLRQQIHRLNTNQSGLAHLVGVSHVTVSDWINGKIEPSPESIGRLAQVLGVPIVDIYEALGRIPGEEEEPPPEIRRTEHKLRGLSLEDIRLVERWIDALLDREVERRSQANGEGEDDRVSD